MGALRTQARTALAHDGLCQASLGLFALIAFLIALGCAPPEQEPKDEVKLTSTSLQATIILPAGCSVGLEQIKVVNTLGEYTVAAKVASQSAQTGQNGAEGIADLQVYEAGPHMAVVVGPNGHPMMMGWLDRQHRQISAQTTAEALMYLGTCLIGIPPEAGPDLLDACRAEDLTDLTDAIATSLAADADAFSGQNDAVADALSQTISSKVQAQAAIIVDPAAPKSGMQVDITRGINTIRFTNTFRRLAHVFIDQTAYVRQDDVEVSQPRPHIDFEISAVTGLEGVFGTFADIARGDFAYAAKSTEEVPLSVVPNAKKTLYKITVVGPGFSQGDRSQLSAIQEEKLRSVFYRFVALDMVLPVLTDVVLPLASVVSGPSAIGNDPHKLEIWADWIEGISKLPGISDDLAKSDVKNAAMTVLGQIAESSQFQAVTYNALTGYLRHVAGTNYHTIAASMHVQRIMIAAQVAQIFLGVFEQFGVQAHMLQSSLADTWQVKVLQPKVVLDPAVRTIKYGQSISLTASVPEVTGSIGEAPTFVYHWTCTCTFGELSDTRGHSGGGFDSSKDTVTYTANSTIAGSDDVTVEVYQLDGAERVLVGSATSKIDVTDDPGQPITFSKITYGPEVIYESARPKVGNDICHKWAVVGYAATWTPPPGTTYMQRPGTTHKLYFPFQYIHREHDHFDLVGRLGIDTTDPNANYAIKVEAWPLYDNPDDYVELALRSLEGFAETWLGGYDRYLAY